MAAPRTWTRLVLSLALLILVGGAAVYMSHSGRHLREDVELDLLSIARLKAAQVASWYEERRGDAAVLGRSLSLSASATRILTTARRVGPDQARPPSGAEQELLRLFSALQGAYGYSDILLVDPEGRILLSLANRSGSLDAEARAQLATALAEDAVSVDDLHTCSFDAQPHLTLLAPVHYIDRQDGPPIGAVALQVEARALLFPMIQSWPRGSASGECVLVRQEGDSVCFLNDLRHRQGTALRLRFPLSRTSLPAVEAVKGKEGVRLGRDYRGVGVVTAFAPVAGTPWYMVAKEDQTEALSLLRMRSTLILLLVGSLLLFSGSVLALLIQREKKAQFRALYHAERKLQGAAHRLRVVLRSIGDAVVATDELGRVELMNPEAGRLTGWPEEEALGRPLEEVFRIVNEETRAAVESPVTRVLRERQVVGLANHTLLQARDGTERPIADSGAPIQEDGALSGVVLVFRDQTEERAAQQGLEESELRFRSTFEQAAVGMAHLGLDGGVLRANLMLCEILGYSRDELLQKKLQQLTHPDDMARDMAGAGELLAGRISVLQGEKRYVHRGGSVIWVDRTASLVRDAAGQPAYYILVVQEITRRKQDEAERERLLAAIEQASEAVVVTDAQARIVYVNPAFEHITGYARQEILGQNPRILKSGRHDAAFYEGMWRKLSAGEAFHGRMINRRKDGGHIIEQVTISPVRDAGGMVVNYVAVERDVTQESSLEDQLRQAQKMEAVGRLAGGVAHDFNNILQAILGYGAMLQEQLTSGGEAADYAGEIVRGAERAAALTRQLLAFSRKQTIAPRVLDLNDTVAGMLRLLGRLIGEDIALQWKPDFNLRPVRMDPEQINQILANLVVNARDAIQGTGSISIETAAATLDADYCAAYEGSAPGDHVVLVVSDSGCGMDEETRARIFEPFFTTKEQGKGTGLGLATVYGIVKQNGGFISVGSAPGRGSTFRVHLPVVPEGEEVERRAVEREDVRAGRETILLVEDEVPLLRYAEQLLQSLGYTVLATDNPLKALGLARANLENIHLLLTDVIMPDMSGRDLHLALAAEIPGLKCLFISGYTSNIIAHQGILDEGLQFLAKPFTRAQLADKLRGILDA